MDNWQCLHRPKRSTGHNSGLAKVAFQFSTETFVVSQTSVLRIKFSSKIPHLRQAQTIPDKTSQYKQISAIG